MQPDSRIQIARIIAITHTHAHVTPAPPNATAATQRSTAFLFDSRRCPGARSLAAPCGCLGEDAERPLSSKTDPLRLQTGSGLSQSKPTRFRPAMDRDEGPASASAAEGVVHAPLPPRCATLKSRFPSPPLRKSGPRRAPKTSPPCPTSTALLTARTCAQ